MDKLPPLIELRAFDAAARHLSFKKASAELGVTPTAISHQIRQLECYCGRALFRRRPRPLTLTEAGVRLFPIIRDGLETFVTAFAAVKRDGDAQPLRVTTTNAFASRYARKLPTDGIAKEFLSDSFWPVCSPELLASGLKRAAGLRGQVLVHCWWSPSDLGAPTWQRWLDAARRKWRDVPESKHMDHLSFREELHAIEAVIAGQGIGIFSDVLVARELAAGTLVRPFDLSLPGYRFYLVRTPGHPREKT